MRFQSIVNFVPDIAQQGFKLLSPATGYVDTIEAIPGANHIFKYTSEGVAIRLEGQNICAPVTGKIIEIIPAVGKVILQAKNKMRFVLQLSLQHIQLNGLGIKFLVTPGQTVKAGQTLINLDLYKIKLQLKPVILYFLILDHQHLKSIDAVRRHVEIAKDPVVSLQLKEKNS